VIGASIRAIGTAVDQQSLRAVLSFCNARQMMAPEAYIHYSRNVFADDGELSNEATEAFLPDFMTKATSGNSDAIANLLTPLVGRVVVSNPSKTRAIAEAKVKTDKVDARVLAQLRELDFHVAQPAEQLERLAATNATIYSASAFGPKDVRVMSLAGDQA